MTKKPDRDFVAEQAARMTEIVCSRTSLPREDLEYVVDKISKIRDDRLQQCVAELIGWSDDDRAELETFIAIAIEVMKDTNVSKLREAARKVELRFYSRKIQNEQLAVSDARRPDGAAEIQTTAQEGPDAR